MLWCRHIKYKLSGRAHTCTHVNITERVGEKLCARPESARGVQDVRAAQRAHRQPGNLRKTLKPKPKFAEKVCSALCAFRLHPRILRPCHPALSFATVSHHGVAALHTCTFVRLIRLCCALTHIFISYDCIKPIIQGKL